MSNKYIKGIVAETVVNSMMMRGRVKIVMCFLAMMKRVSVLLITHYRKLIKIILELRIIMLLTNLAWFFQVVFFKAIWINNIVDHLNIYKYNNFNQIFYIYI
jgi:hypothetical protein